MDTINLVFTLVNNLILFRNRWRDGIPRKAPIKILLVSN